MKGSNNPRWTDIMLLGLCAAATVTLSACFPWETEEAEEEVWWEGTEEPDYSDKADGIIPLTIFANGQLDMRKTVDPELIDHALSFKAGQFTLSGLSLTEDTVIIIDGYLHRYDQRAEEHRLVVKPRFVTFEEGAANQDGYFVVDLNDSDSVSVHALGGDTFGSVPGVFRGMIIATQAVTLIDDLDEDLRNYFIRPARINERVPNALQRQSIVIRPNIMLGKLLPSDVHSCYGESVLDVTTSTTQLSSSILLDGFPLGTMVRVEVSFREPWNVSDGMVQSFWNFWRSMFSDNLQERKEEHLVRVDHEGVVEVPLNDFYTKRIARGDDLYVLDIEVRAADTRGLGASAAPYRHRLTVVEKGAEIIIDNFELCPINDDLCRAFRDADAPHNIIARRNTTEQQAAQAGYYQARWDRITRCRGGDAIEGHFSSTCAIYREEDDYDIEMNLAGQLNFELKVDGSAHQRADWSGAVPGVGGAALEQSLKAAFHLSTDLRSEFKASRTWKSRSSLDVLYDSSTTQIQWWRVSRPRLYYLEVAAFDKCGIQESSTEIFLTELQSRLVLACAETGGYDEICHDVVPTARAVEACNDLLIPTDSDRALLCLE